jgi:hypothetical protein
MSLKRQKGLRIRKATLNAAGRQRHDKRLHNLECDLRPQRLNHSKSLRTVTDQLLDFIICPHFPGHEQDFAAAQVEIVAGLRPTVLVLQRGHQFVRMDGNSGHS